jgi:hypothetical protein
VSCAERVLALDGAWVEALVLLGEVEVPVLVEVAVADDGAQGEDGLGAVEAPSGASYAEAVGDDVAAGALDDPGGDRPALREGLVVAEAAGPGGEVAGACAGSGALGPGEAGGAGLGGDVAGDAVAVAGEDGEGLDGGPVLGGRVAGIVEAPGGLPYVTRSRGSGR